MDEYDMMFATIKSSQRKEFLKYAMLLAKGAAAAAAAGS